MSTSAHQFRPKRVYTVTPIPGTPGGHEYSRQSEQNKTGSFKRIGLPVLLIAGLVAAGVVAKENSKEQPPISGGGGQGGGGAVPEGYDSGAEGSGGGTGSDVRSNNLCARETSAVRAAASTILGSADCKPPLGPDITGANWVGPTGEDNSLTVVVGSRQDAVSPNDLRDPKKNFVKHWTSYDIGTGSDTFCNAERHSIAVYQGDLVMNITLQDPRNTIQPGCPESLAVFARTVVRSDMA